MAKVFRRDGCGRYWGALGAGQFPVGRLAHQVGESLGETDQEQPGVEFRAVGCEASGGRGPVSRREFRSEVQRRGAERLNGGMRCAFPPLPREFFRVFFCIRLILMIWLIIMFQSKVIFAR